MSNLAQIIKHMSPRPWTYDVKLADAGNKETEMSSGSEMICEPVCIIPHDDITEEGYEEVRANARAIVLFTEHGPALVEIVRDLMSMCVLRTDSEMERYRAAETLLEQIEREAGI